MRSLTAALMLIAGVQMVASVQPPESLTELSSLVISNAGETETVNRIAAAARDDILTVSDRGARYTLESERRFYLGIAALNQGREQEAEAHFADSVERAEQALSFGESAAAHRALSNGIQQLLPIRGFFYQVANAGRALESARKAVALDAEDAHSRISLISFLTAAPSLAGGNAEEAERQLQLADALSGDEETTVFMLFLWRAELRSRNGDIEAAEAALARAREIFPQSRLLRETEARIRQGRQSR